MVLHDLGPRRRLQADVHGGGRPRGGYSIGILSAQRRVGAVSAIPETGMRFKVVAMVLALAVGGFEAAADDAAVIPHRRERVPNKPVAAELAARRMTIPDGFHVDVVANEPQ